MRPPLIERYRNLLPVSEKTPVISLLEGSTPLIPLKGPEEARKKGIRLYAKYEGLNPTGSFKDRGMTCAVSAAMSRGRSPLSPTVRRRSRSPRIRSRKRAARCN